jgi:hypothetical protein
MKRTFSNALLQDEKSTANEPTFLNLFLEFGDQLFVRNFLAQAMSHIALNPKHPDAIRELMRVNWCFYESYCLMNKTIIFPWLDGLFAQLSTEYDQWDPKSHIVPRNDPDEQGEPDQFVFTPFSSVLKYAPSKGKLHVTESIQRINPIIDRGSFIAWLSQHRYPSPMSDDDLDAVLESLDAFSWISWVQDLLKKRPVAHFSGKPWTSQQIPTIICSTLAVSHRCVDGALMRLCLAWSTSRERLRELLLVVLFYIFTTSVWAKKVTLSGHIWAIIDNMLVQDKHRADLSAWESFNRRSGFAHVLSV